MSKLFYLLSIFASISISKAFIRTGITLNGDVISNVEPQGVIVKKLNETSTEILYTEEFNADTNPLKLYWNFFFENTGVRQIEEIDNLCAKQKYGSPKYAAKSYVLNFFANTDKCPIKKGTKVIYTIGIPFTHINTNPSCGINHGSFSLFKKNVDGKSPLVFLFNFRSNVTGDDC
ncbi:uncharacterized protein LOC127288373 [Leptopilina boulardi]|uniref:uncharacterized protein LOC127288373 n=1 Tax=Leptopilina boulardi TaxID=63433 RepID=UPI0021F61577|nr:uncharacterized protein LOC127288373 [Leptopilina boulardi]